MSLMTTLSLHIRRNQLFHTLESESTVQRFDANSMIPNLDKFQATILTDV